MSYVEVNFGAGATPLMKAAFGGDTSLVRELIGDGANVNTQSDSGATALMWAAAGGGETVKALLECDANVHLKTEEGNTALLAAAWGGLEHTAECVRLLLEAGADVSERNNDGLGRAYKEQGEIESAIEHYEKALAVDPLNNLAPHQREALAELRAGKAAAN